MLKHRIKKQEEEQSFCSILQDQRDELSKLKEEETELRLQISKLKKKVGDLTKNADITSFTPDDRKTYIKNS